MSDRLLSSELWIPWLPALEKYAEATGLTVQLFGLEAGLALATARPTPLVELFLQYGFEPGLFAECARRCIKQTQTRPAVAVSESHGLTVVGASLVLDGTVVGAAVAGYALAGFSNVTTVRRWAQLTGIPFDRLWHIVRRQPPVPERRLMLHGELLQILGDALLRENHRTRQYQEAVVKLQAASAAKDEFLAVLSHELRTPLSPILGWAGVLRTNPPPEHVREAAEVIERNVLFQSRMIEDLLDVNRIAHGSVSLDFEILDVSALIRAALEASARGIEEKAIRLEIHDAGASLFVKGDSGRLQQVFRNVISNAVKFTPAGGDISITMKREANDVLVIVADTGAGITPEFLPFAFDIFRQQEQGTRRKHQGLGIGLALVKKLIELHQGTVIVTSAGLGRGAEVTVRLPSSAEAPAVDHAAPAGATPRSALAGRSFLVVEDTDDTRDILQRLLHTLGAEVWVARDGREALDIILNANPDVVLCDLRMPRMDGFEFIHELHQRTAGLHPPVVAMSGLASDADHQRTRDAGFAGHINKPFDEATIIAAVAAAQLPGLRG